jgi:hypothetical protein
MPRPERSRPIDGADALTNEQFKSVIEKALRLEHARWTTAETKPQGGDTTDENGDGGTREAE